VVENGEPLRGWRFFEGEVLEGFQVVVEKRGSESEGIRGSDQSYEYKYSAGL